jgi:hypothetical protein
MKKIFGNQDRRQFLSLSSMALGATVLAKPFNLLHAAEDTALAKEEADSGAGKYGSNIILSQKAEAGKRGIPMFNTMDLSIPEFSSVLIGRMPPPGPMIGHEIHEKHDGEKEYLIHLGNDADDPMDLGADVELYLGRSKWREKHTFNKATSVYLPCGLWHCPWHVRNIRRAVSFVNIRVKYDLPAEPSTYKITKLKMGGPPTQSSESLSAEELSRAKTSGGIFGQYLLPDSVKGKEDPKGGKWLAYLDCTMIAEAPLTRVLRYRPLNEQYSIIDEQRHEYGTLFVMLGTNLNDHTDLGAEVELSIGPEKEKHTIDKSAIVYVPPRTEHGPFVVKNARAPFNFVELVGGPEMPGAFYGPGGAKVDSYSV